MASMVYPSQRVSHGPISNPPSDNKMGTLAYYAGALVGATAIGVALTKAPAMDVATSLGGALGATLGFAAGSMLGKNSKYMSVYGFAGALGVPMLVGGGQVDVVNIGIAAGAVGGGMAAGMILKDY